jgi:hypothetical protein
MCVSSLDEHAVALVAGSAAAAELRPLLILFIRTSNLALSVAGKDDEQLSKLLFILITFITGVVTLKAAYFTLDDRLSSEVDVDANVSAGTAGGLRSKFSELKLYALVKRLLRGVTVLIVACADDPPSSDGHRSFNLSNSFACSNENFFS